MDEAAVVGPVGRARAGLDRRRRQPLVDDPLLDDDLAVAEVGLARRGEALDDVGADVGEQQHVVARAAASGLDDDGQRVVVDEHEVGGVLADGPVLGDDRHHRLADVAHDVAGHERPAHALREAGHEVRREAQLGRGRSPVNTARTPGAAGASVDVDGARCGRGRAASGRR